MLFNVNKLLFFDIESVSQYESLYDMDESKQDMWMKYSKSFLKKVTDENRLKLHEEGSDDYYNEIYRQTSAFFPEFGKVACVSMAFVNKGEVKYESFYGGDEIEILEGVRNVFNKIDPLGYDLCGHSIKMFDIPFLGKRYYINGMLPPSIFPKHSTKPWEMRTLDTKDVWQFGNNWALGSLDLVCMSLDIDSPKNGDVKGDSVNSNYWDGKHVEIKEYCEKDVKALVDMIMNLNNLK